jgi:hypothetical protein
MSRLDDADRLLDLSMKSGGQEPPVRPMGRCADFDAVMACAGMEGDAVARALAVAAGGHFALAEVFIAGMIVGLAAAQSEGLAWAEWALDEAPLINVGIARSCARRIVAGWTE